MVNKPDIGMSFGQSYGWNELPVVVAFATAHQLKLPGSAGIENSTCELAERWPPETVWQLDVLQLRVVAAHELFVFVDSTSHCVHDCVLSLMYTAE